jgi:serine/threonine-protein kinase
MSTPSPSADRNLVFGLLALQMDFVTREQLLDAMHAWMLQKQTPLGDILCRRGVLAADERQVLDLALEKHVRRHGDAQASLAALRVEPAVRQHLQRLNDADVQASLASLPAAGAFDPLATSGVAVVVPTGVRYRRLREHARGGLGEVHVALDEELKREVALKEIQNPFADQSETRARFVREAEITGKLEHPGVVPVYGLGAYPDGRPYYAMRFIRGESMQQAIAHFHRADQQPRRDPGERSLALRELLTRFVAVCNAVAYAHSRGVIHRDLKPANVMLGEYGETLVVDWGLARLLDQPDSEQTTAERPLLLNPGSRTEPTEMGRVVGTPAFMAPEQADGRPDRLGPHSDIFALGATLYALLTGMPPYTGPDAVAMACRADVVPARQRLRRVPAALEAVCAKAMARAPEQRYPTARALAQDVQRFLADEPVEAYREPLPARLRRWGRRHRTVVAGGVMLLVGGVVALSLGLWAVGREQARTRLALAQAETNLEQAEANLALARDAVDQCFNVAKEHPLFQQPRMEEAKKLLLKKTLPFYRRFRSQRPDDPDLQRQQAEQFFRVGYIEKALGHQAAARTAYQEARAIGVELVQAHPDVPEYLQALGLTHNNLGALLVELGKHQEALREYQDAQQVRLKLVRARPEEAAYRHDLAVTHTNLGSLLADLGKSEEAIAQYRRAGDLQVVLARARPDVARYQGALAVTCTNLADLLANLGRRAAARREYGRARDIQARLVQAYPREPEHQKDLVRTRSNLGLLLVALGQPDEALQEYRQGCDLGGRLVRAHPDVPRYQQILANTHNNLGNLLRSLRKRDEALKEHQQARDLRRRLVQAHPNVPDYQNELAASHHNLGHLLADRGQHDEALQEYHQAREVRYRLVKAHPDVPRYRDGLARTCLNRGVILGWTKQFSASLADLDEAIALLDAHRFQGSSLLLTALPERAAVLTRLGRLPEADADWDRAVKLAPAARRPELRGRRAEGLAQAGHYLRAAAAVDELARGNLPGRFLYNLGCLQAINADRAAADASRPLPLRERFAEQAARSAVALLERAAAAGFFRKPGSVALLDTGSDLAGLRRRDDYKRFRTGLESVK